MKVALVHYWLANMRGGERVLEALCDLYPHADIFTHVYTPENISPTIRKHNIYTTFINKLPFAKKKYQYYLPLMPLALEQLDLRGYDLVISSESGPAKGILTSPHTLHVCYCHTPMRYIWDFYHDYLNHVSWFSRFFMRCTAHYLRMWDSLSANRVDAFIANSQNVAKRIQKHYRRDSTVIYPPVDVQGFTPPNANYPTPSDYFVYLGQLVEYKRVDLAVDAFTKLGKKLIVIGEGPDMQRLQQRAGNCVTFLGRQNEESIFYYLQNCQALIFPGEEDFGIVPVEAMAAGRPVIAFGRGGALETVIPGKSGILFDEQSVPALIEAINTYLGNPGVFSPYQLSEHAKSFSHDVFTHKFEKTIQKLLKNKK